MTNSRPHCLTAITDNILLLLIILTVTLLSRIAEAAPAEIVYVSPVDGRWQIFSSDVYGATITQLTSPQTADMADKADRTDKRRPRWLGKQKEVLYASKEGQLYIYNQAKAASRLIRIATNANGDPAWNEATETLALVNYSKPREYQSEIWLAQKNTADGSGDFILTQRIQVPSGLLTSPAWAPDGSRLYYSRLDKIGPAGTVENICSYDLETRQEETLIANGYDNSYASLSPDGKSMLYASDIEGNYDIWLMDLSTKHTSRQTISPAMDSQPDWSPDGKQFVFVSARTGQRQIWTKSIDGEDVRQISRNQQPAQDPHWQKNP